MLAAAVDLDILAAAAPNQSGMIRVQSQGYPLIVVDLRERDPRPEERNTSAALIRGVAARLAELGCSFAGAGVDVYMTSSVPGGSGLSSSAAFEVLMGTLLNDLFFGGRCTPVELAQIGQYAENVYFGKPCGLMDQTASSVGGVVAIGGRDLDGMSAKELARHVSVVLTDRIEPELMTCWEAVAAGRYPYTNHFGKPSREDQRSVEDSMARVNALELREQRAEMVEASERKRQSILRVEREWIMRGCKARTTKSKERIQRYEALLNQEAPETDEAVQMAAASSRLGKKIIELRDVSKAFDGRPIVSRFSYNLLRGDRSGIVGRNGAGKSTLIQAIDPSLDIRTGEISESHHKGRHTTTFSTMYPLAGGGAVIDTPGIKGFGLIDIDEAELWHYFPEMMRVAPACRFYNCTHTHEPGCAVTEAVKAGEIAWPRYESYLKIRDEDEKYRK